MNTIHLGDCENGCLVCAQNCDCNKCKRERGRGRVCEWELLGNYGYGWELLTTASTRSEINQLERDYRLNEPATRLKINRVWERASR